MNGYYTRGEFRPAHWFGQVVYHRMADSARRGCVTALWVRPHGVLYEVSWGSGSSTLHYDFELTAEYEPDFGGAD